MPQTQSILASLALIAFWWQPSQRFEQALDRANAVLAKAHLIARNSELSVASQPASRPGSQPAPPTRDETLQRIRDMGIFSGEFELTMRPTSVLSLPGGGIVVDADVSGRSRPLSYYYYDVEHQYLRTLDEWVKQRVSQLMRDEAILNIQTDSAEREVYRQRDAQVRKIDERAARRKQFYETLHMQIRVTDDQAAATKAAVQIGQDWTATVRIDSFELKPAFVEPPPESAPAETDISDLKNAASKPTRSTEDLELARRKAAELVNTLPPTIGSLRATLVAR